MAGATLRVIPNDDGGWFVLGTHDLQEASAALLDYIGADHPQAVNVRPDTARLDWFKGVPAEDGGTYFHGGMEGVRGASRAVFWDYSGFFLGQTPEETAEVSLARVRSSLGVTAAMHA